MAEGPTLFRYVLCAFHILFFPLSSVYNWMRPLASIPSEVIAGCVASHLHPNEVVTTLRLVCKEWARSIHGRRVSVSQPILEHAFHWRFGPLERAIIATSDLTAFEVQTVKAATVIAAVRYGEAT